MWKSLSAFFQRTLAPAVWEGPEPGGSSLIILPKLHKPKRGKKLAFQFELIGLSKPPDFAVVSRTTSLGVIFFLVLRCQGEPFKMALS